MLCIKVNLIVYFCQGGDMLYLSHKRNQDRIILFKNKQFGYTFLLLTKISDFHLYSNSVVKFT